MTTGLKNVLSNLNKEIRKIEGDVHKGMIKVASHIKAESVERTPIDEGGLRGSAFGQTERLETGSVARVGYAKKYAPWVHEMPMTLKGQPRAHFGITGNQSAFGPQQRVAFGGGSGKGVYWQDGENKFLQKAVSENHGFILKLIRDSAVIKK